MNALEKTIESQTEPEVSENLEATVTTLRDEKTKRFPVRRVLATAANIAFALIIITCATIITVSALMRMNGGRAKILGYSMYTVMSGSMEPTIPTGALIVGKEVPADKIKVGDVITYAISGVVTHRVREINYEQDTDYYSFITRGDANETDDPTPVPSANVIGVVKASFPFVGKLIKFFQPPGAGLLIVIAAGMLIVFIEGNRLYRALVERKQKKNLCPTPEQPVQ